jgi:hypothetical protein
MRWSVGDSEWHGWHTNAYPLKFLDSFRIVDSGVEAQAAFSGGEPVLRVSPKR